MNISGQVRAGIAALGAALMLALPGLAAAQATRTWVSGVGDDANPCSRTAPCKTFAGAISKTATNGEINCLDPAGFGAVTITKSIVIDCSSTLGGILSSGTNGINVNATGGVVALRGLDINGAGTGISGVRVIAANTVAIENSVIRGVGASNGSGIEVVNNAANVKVNVVNVIVRENAGHGVYVHPSAGFLASVTVEGSNFSANGLTGMRVDDGVTASLTATILSHNGTHGFTALSTSGVPTKASLERVTSSSNGNGGVLGSGPGVSIYMSNLLTSGNAYGVYPAQGGALYYSFGNNRSAGNSTSDAVSAMPVASF